MSACAQPQLSEVLGVYDFGAPFVGVLPFGQGHVNDTFCVHLQPSDGSCLRYILQRLSHTAFAHPQKLMANVVAITDYLQRQIRQEGGDPRREALNLLRTQSGDAYYTDHTGRVWRAYLFVEQTICFQSAPTPQLFESSGRAFGRFQYQLRDYPAHTLFETIPDFHNTERRLARFEQALAQDVMGRAREVQPEVEFILAHRSDCSVLMSALSQGRLPLRVTHNDTKLNNVLMDRTTGEGVCVVDLDTVMPGLSVHDFGDSIRFGATRSSEDERDLSKVNFDLLLFESYTRGFLSGSRGILTADEIHYLPWGAKVMTLECGIRFLTDYLEGDHYFAIHRPQQNLDRCRTQLKLVSDMEAAWAEMERLVQAHLPKTSE